MSEFYFPSTSQVRVEDFSSEGLIRRNDYLAMVIQEYSLTGYQLSGKGTTNTFSRIL